MKRGNTIWWGAIAVGGLLLAGSLVAYAQGGGTGAGHRHPGFARIGQMLNLTTDQQSKARVIFQGVRKDAMAVLTPAQRKQFRTDMTDMRKQHLQQRGQMFKALNLTAEQQASIKTIHTAARTQAQAIRNDAKLSKDEQRTQLMALRRDTMQKIEQVLTPEQQAQFKAQRQQHQPGAMIKREADRLQLTADQRGKLQNIFDKAKADFRQLLTPEQQQQLDTFSKEHGWDQFSIR